MKEKYTIPKEFHDKKIVEGFRKGEPSVIRREEKETKETLTSELTSLINRYSRENDSNTPDWILANYMMNCLRAGEYLVNMREQWNKHK